MLNEAMSRGLGLRRFRLTGPTGNGRHPYFDEGGAFLGPGVAATIRGLRPIVEQRSP